jgi:predicted AlkP superfamily phosphohydrolase/phosphomutase
MKSGRRQEVGKDGTKALIVGIDGAAYPLVRTWSEKGKLRHIGRLIRKGAFGPLRSTVPPITLPAIPSFMTGKNPGKHGVASFFRPKKDSSLGLVSSGSVSGEFWNADGMRGKTKLIVNLPLTWPAKPLKGVMVTGLMTPNKDDRGFLYPTVLRKELGARLDTYEIDVETDPIPGHERSFLKACIDVTLDQLELMERLMRTHEWELGIVYFTILDRLQHHLFGAKGNAYVLEGYRAVDGCIGELASSMDGDADIIVFSDHGFGRSRGRFYPNAWLMERGLLHLKGRRRSLMGKVQSLQSNKGLRALVGLLPEGLVRRTFGLIEGSSGSYDFSSIDWRRTRVFATISGMHVNPAFASEREELLDTVKRGLAELEGPGERGKKRLKVEAQRREEVYSGDKVGNLPDIVYKVDGYAYEPFASFDQVRPVQRFDGPTKGWHREEGIIIASGKDISHARLERASILDIAPTVLHLFGCRIPSDMDGKVLNEMFRKGPGPGGRPVVMGDEPSSDPTSREKENIRARVRSLRERGGI